jgi:hypothetical protein
MPCIHVCSMPIFAYFLIVSHTEPTPVLFDSSAFHSLLSYSYCSAGKLANDWLAGGLEAARASATVFGHTQTENQKIEEWLLVTMAGSKLAPLMSSELSSICIILPALGF